MQKKDDKVANKKAYKEERQRKKEGEREWSWKDRNRFSKKFKFWLVRMCEKTKTMFRFSV